MGWGIKWFNQTEVSFSQICSLHLERNEDLTSYNDLLVCFYFSPHAIVFLEDNFLAYFPICFVSVFTFKKGFYVWETHREFKILHRLLLRQRYLGQGGSVFLCLQMKKEKGFSE